MYTCHIVALCTPHHHLQILVVQMVGLLKKTHIHFFGPGPSFSPPTSSTSCQELYRGGRGVPLPCWYLVVLAEAILLWSMWQRLLQRCLTIRDVFASGWSAFWCCEKWDFNHAGEIDKCSSVRYDNFPHKRDAWGKRGRCCLRVD